MQQTVFNETKHSMVAAYYALERQMRLPIWLYMRIYYAIILYRNADYEYMKKKKNDKYRGKI